MAAGLGVLGLEVGGSEEIGVHVDVGGGNFVGFDCVVGGVAFKFVGGVIVVLFVKADACHGDFGVFEIK